jgi:hypothetical protein
VAVHVGDLRVACAVTGPRALDLDHLCAQVGEEQAGVRRGDHLPELKDPDTFQRLHLWASTAGMVRGPRCCRENSSAAAATRPLSTGSWSSL